MWPSLGVDLSPFTVPAPTIDQSSSCSLVYARLVKSGRRSTPDRQRCFCCEKFTVPKQNSTTLLLVVDVSHLNHFIAPYWFHMLTVAQVHLCCHLGAWFMTLNLEKAHWCVPITPRYRCFLSIQVRETFLSFSVTLAPWVFTKVIKTHGFGFYQAGL